MQVKVGEGVREAVGAENIETAKNERGDDEESEGGDAGRKDTDRTAGEVERGRNRKASPSIA